MLVGASVIGTTTWKDVLVTYQPVFNTLAIGLVAFITWYVKRRVDENKARLDDVDRKVRKVQPKAGGRRAYDPPKQQRQSD